MEDYDAPHAQTFATRLKALRATAALTMSQLGERVKPAMPASSVARYEAGKRMPSWGAVVRFAIALGCTPNDFLAKPKKRK